MNKSNLVAVLACRVTGNRLFGKPLQYLDIADKITTLDHQIFNLKKINCIDDIVLVIAEGKANAVFVDYAKKHNVKYIIGDENNVLERMLFGARVAKAVNVFRITTECPYIAWDMIEDTYQQHVKNSNDITVVDYMPEGCNFEIFKLSALEISFSNDQSPQNLEHTNVHFRKNLHLFRMQIVEPQSNRKRLDLRLTIDNPEDLVLCRNIYKYFKNSMPDISIDKIITYLDENPHIHKIVEPFVDMRPVWASALQNA